MIEEAVRSIEGVNQAIWVVEKQELEVFYDDTKVDTDNIEMAVAEKGFDITTHTATDNACKAFPDE